MDRPVIFISAVSGELRTARDLVAKTLTSLGYERKWQDIAPVDARLSASSAHAVTITAGGIPSPDGAACLRC